MLNVDSTKTGLRTSPLTQHYGSVVQKQLCHACGRRWTPSERTFTSMGLRARRVGRRVGLRLSWAHPRPARQCPSCTSRDVSTASVITLP